MKIQVTEADMERWKEIKSCSLRTCNCPVANAIMRATGSTYVMVGKRDGFYQLDDDAFVFDLPDEAQAWVDEFDRWDKSNAALEERPELIEFELETENA